MLDELADADSGALFAWINDRELVEFHSALAFGAAACGSSDTTTTTPAATTTAPAATTAAPTTTQQNNPQGDCPDGEQYDAATGNCYPDGQTIPE